MPHARSKWQHLLGDPDVRRWHDNLARGALCTAENYVRLLGRFLDVGGLSPKAYVELPSAERENLLSDFIEAELAQGKAGSYLVT